MPHSNAWSASAPTPKRRAAIRATIGIEGGVRVAEGGPDAWMKTVEAWRTLGATHVCLNTMNAGLKTLAEHLEAVRRFSEAAG